MAQQNAVVNFGRRLDVKIRVPEMPILHGSYFRKGIVKFIAKTWSVIDIVFVKNEGRLNPVTYQSHPGYLLLTRQSNNEPSILQIGILQES